jgi:hypothetical protein
VPLHELSARHSHREALSGDGHCLYADSNSSLVQGIHRSHVKLHVSPVVSRTETSHSHDHRACE